MDDTLSWRFQCLSLLGPDLAACYGELEGHGVPAREALGAILARPPLKAWTPALARARCGAALAQARPDLFGMLAELLAEEGIHPMSMLGWDGWDPDQALELLSTHWRGPGRLPVALLGIGRVYCADLRILPRGLHLQGLSLDHGRDLQALPEGLQVQERLECRDLGLRQVPSGLFCGGDLVLADLPRLEGWGHGIRVLGDLILGDLPGRAKLPSDLQVDGVRRKAPASRWKRKG